MTDLIQNDDLGNAKIDMACENFKKVKRSSNDKFSNLDAWLKKESKIFFNETLHKPVRYMKYKPGTIVKVDFGVNIGTELSNLHFAIVMDNDDNVYKGTVCVVPLTSKDGNCKLDLGSLIFDEYKKQINKISKKKNCKLEKDLAELKLEYKKYNKRSYANISQMRCISKSRIKFSKIKYDIIGKTKVSDKVLTKIKKEISKEFL